MICYDLTDEKWRYVEITKDGWKIKNDDSSVLFARHNQVAQVLPDRNYEPNILDKFIGLTNVKDDKDKLLLKVYTISLFIPDIAHAMLILHGEKGAAKTLLEWLIKQLVDPSRPALLTIHTSRDEFVQQLSTYTAVLVVVLVGVMCYFLYYYARYRYNSLIDISY